MLESIIIFEGFLVEGEAKKTPREEKQKEDTMRQSMVIHILMLYPIRITPGITKTALMPRPKIIPAKISPSKMVFTVTGKERSLS